MTFVRDEPGRGRDEGTTRVRIVPIAERYEYATLIVFPQGDIQGQHLWCLLTEATEDRLSGLIPLGREGEVAVFNEVGAAGWLLDESIPSLRFPQWQWFEEIAQEVATALGRPEAAARVTSAMTTCGARRRLVD